MGWCSWPNNARPTIKCLVEFRPLNRFKLTESSLFNLIWRHPKTGKRRIYACFSSRVNE